MGITTNRAAGPAALIVASLWFAACETGDLPQGPPTALFLPDSGRLVLTRPAPAETGIAQVRLNRLRLSKGWSGAEEAGTWAVGARASLQFVAREAVGHVLEFECRPPAIDRQQSVRLSVNGVAAGDLTLEPGWKRYTQTLPEGAMRKGANQLTLDFAFHHSPAGPGGKDSRQLAAQFRGIAVTDPAGRGAEAGLSYVPILPEEAEKAAAALAADGRAAAWRSIATESLSATPRSAPGCLVFATDGAQDPVVPRLQVLSRPARPPTRIEKARPDIFVVVLDAARPDHFGAYGYSRDTTPHIDRLATEGWAFENARATTPTTLSSLPTMITGLSVLDHGVVERGAVLAERAQTMAEALSAVGYRTVCLSSNPNHAMSQRFDQGCAEFEELWREVVDRGLDPMVVTHRARELLDEPDDRPLFMFLHYMPPHEPYRPEPRFDVFGDDAYDGWADGELATRLAIDAGKRQVSAADMAEIVALYDGLLLEGDHAVGDLLDALRARDRWDESVVIVTADHGEAFLDHGRMGHNTTVYDEMLRVPLIVRVPPGRRPAAVDTTAPATLEDLLPTVLARAGIDPVAEVAGYDLLGPRRANRLTVARTNGQRPTWAVMIAAWKAILHAGWAKAELYDLDRDPGERNDLGPEEFDRLVCLAAFLTRELAREPAFRPVDADVELDEEMRERLRSIGYVD